MNLNTELARSVKQRLKIKILLYNIQDFNLQHWGYQHQYKLNLSDKFTQNYLTCKYYTTQYRLILSQKLLFYVDTKKVALLRVPPSEHFDMELQLESTYGYEQTSNSS